MPAPIGTAWLRPTSTDPHDLIDRKDDTQRLRARLLDYVFEGRGRARLLISGERGVGKSILTRTVLDAVAADAPDTVVTVVVNGRGIGYRRFLEQFARDLAAAVRPHSIRWRKDFAVWLDQLLALANSTQITRSQADSIAKTYGFEYGSEIELGVATPISLVNKLSSKFAWEESRSVTRGTERVMQVTDAVLHAAIESLLVRMREEQNPTSVVVFYDDLDQAFDGVQTAEIESNVQRVLELQPCIALAHIRTESMYPNVRRVIDQELAVMALQPDDLLEMVRHRAAKARAPVRAVLGPTSAVWTHLRRLASVTGNALAFLRWSEAFLGLWGPEPAHDWTTDQELRKIALEATPAAAVDSGLLVELAALVDRCTVLEGCSWADLVRGGRSLMPVQQTLDPTVLGRLRSLGFVVQRNRFDEHDIVRLEPTLELLRPSVAEQLRKSPA